MKITRIILCMALAAIPVFAQNGGVSTTVDELMLKSFDQKAADQYNDWIEATSTYNPTGKWNELQISMFVSGYEQLKGIEIYCARRGDTLGKQFGITPKSVHELRQRLAARILDDLSERIASMEPFREVIPFTRWTINADWSDSRDLRQLSQMRTYRQDLRVENKELGPATGEIPSPQASTVDSGPLQPVQKN